MGGVTRGPARRSAAVAVANLLHRQHTAQAGGIFFVPRFFVLTHAVTLGDQGTGESAKPPAIVAGGYIGEEGARWWWKKQKRVHVTCIIIIPIFSGLQLFQPQMN